MPNCTAEQMTFRRLGRRQIEANFEGGALSIAFGRLPTQLSLYRTPQTMSLRLATAFYCRRFCTQVSTLPSPLLQLRVGSSRSPAWEATGRRRQAMSGR
jgi:hypothetical protein